MNGPVTAPIPTARPLAPAHAPENGNGRGHSPAAAEHDHDAVDLNVSKPSSFWIIAVCVVGVIVLAVLFSVGVIPRLLNHKQLDADAETALNAPIPVAVITPRRANKTIDVLLPGTLRPWQEVSLYSRATGYLKLRPADISSIVKKNELMAVVSSPDIDQQYQTALATLELQKAALTKAQTDLEFADKTNKRYQQLIGTNGVTQVEIDQFQANYNSALAVANQAKAQVDVAASNRDQLATLKSFEEIRAPFPGVVTARAFDIGAYIMANPTSVDILPLFKLAENDVLRAFINVPQSYALTVKQHMKVTISARELPGKEFVGEVLGTTNYLDPAARSLLTEVRIENPDFALLPGMYIQASFHVERETPPLIIPGPALVINADGNQVATVRDGKVHFVPVQLGVDFGTEIEIIGGLTGDEQVIGNPGEKTVENAAVKVISESKPAPAAEALKEKQKVASVEK